MLWFVGLAEVAVPFAPCENLVTKVGGVTMIGPQILGLRIGNLMTWLQLCLVMELGMMTVGG